MDERACGTRGMSTQLLVTGIPEPIPLLIRKLLAIASGPRMPPQCSTQQHLLRETLANILEATGSFDC